MKEKLVYGGKKFANNRLRRREKESGERNIDCGGEKSFRGTKDSVRGKNSEQKTKCKRK